MNVKFGIGQSVEGLVEYRKEVRAKKDYKLADAIRNYLDEQLVFVFDQKDGAQDVYYLTESHFKRKTNWVEKLAKRSLESEDDKESQILFKEMEMFSKMTNRQYVEHRIKEDIKAEKIFDAWLFSTSSNKEK